MQPTVYRHELKYEISYADYLAVRQRLRPVMQVDSHAGADGRYLVRSIYFDNPYDKVLREKRDGIQKREKFRIRYYNDDLSFLALEKKSKYNSLGQKTHAVLTEAECRALLCGNTADWMPNHPSALVRELYSKLHTQLLRPRVQVSYLREPYVYAPGNVRVTFDSDIRSSLYRLDFLTPQSPDIRMTEQPGDMVMEVKYDAFLPELIACLLQTGHTRQRAFSKYGTCRQFG